MELNATLSERTQRIIDWRESLTLLSTEKFFEIIHVYLGEIQTPYNKQKLAESLGAFLRDKNNRESIVSLLSIKDVTFLTAIKYINECTSEKLMSFFSASYPAEEVYEEIQQLQDRLLVYFRKDKLSGKNVLDLNPMLDEEMDQIIDIANIIQSKEIPASSKSPKLFLNPQLVLVFISYIFGHPDLCKSSGELKKKSTNGLCSIFDCEKEDTVIFQQLVFSMKNLGLVAEKGEEIEIQWKKLEQFSRLEFKNQVAYLCAASAGHFTRSTILNNARLFNETIKFMSDKGFERRNIFEITYLMKEKNGGAKTFSTSRLSRLIARANEENDASDLSSMMMEMMLDAAMNFGVLNEEENILSVVDYVYNQQFSNSIKPVSLDAGFNITLMPGSSLGEILGLAKFLSPTKCDIAATFEISRKGVFRSLDAGLDVDGIVQLLESLSSFPISQNLKFSLNEWNESYNSASLYRGYVLKLSEETAYIAEKNPALSSKVLEILAPGIFLLDFESDEEAKAVLEKCGLDFAGNVRTSKKDEQFAVLPEIFDSQVPQWSITKSFVVDESKAQNLISELKDELEKIEMTPEQKFGLMGRIEKKLIVSKEQLRPESVRFELLEASGMDFTGKIHLIESIIEKQYWAEISISGQKQPVYGKIKNLAKNVEEPEISVSKPDGTMMTISVASISKLVKTFGIS